MNFSDIEMPSNRKFGFFFTTVFLILGFYFQYKELSLFYLLFYTLSFLFLIITIINSNLLLPLNKLWMQLGLLLGRIISPLVLGIIFFLIFTPISLIFRIVGRDELHLKFKDKKSYWILRNSNFIKSGTFKNQF